MTGWLLETGEWSLFPLPVEVSKQWIALDPAGSPAAYWQFTDDGQYRYCNGTGGPNVACLNVTVDGCRALAASNGSVGYRTSCLPAAGFASTVACAKRFLYSNYTQPRDCPPGYYCPVGTALATHNPCPVGTRLLSMGWSITNSPPLSMSESHERLKAKINKIGMVSTLSIAILNTSDTHKFRGACLETLHVAGLPSTPTTGGGGEGEGPAGDVQQPDQPGQRQPVPGVPAGSILRHPWPAGPNRPLRRGVLLRRQRHHRHATGQRHRRPAPQLLLSIHAHPNDRLIRFQAQWVSPVGLVRYSSPSPLKAPFSRLFPTTLPCSDLWCRRVAVRRPPSPNFQMRISLTGPW